MVPVAILAMRLSKTANMERWAVVAFVVVCQSDVLVGDAGLGPHGFMSQPIPFFFG